MRKVIERLLLDKDIKKGELASACGWKSTTLSVKLKKDFFTLEDLIKISDSLDVGLEVSFIEKDGTRVPVYRKNDETIE